MLLIQLFTLCGYHHRSPRKMWLRLYLCNGCGEDNKFLTIASQYLGDRKILPKLGLYFVERGRLIVSITACAASSHRRQAVAHLPGAQPDAAYEWPNNDVAAAYWWPLLYRQPKWLPVQNVSLENTAIHMRMSTEGIFPCPALASSRALFGFSAWLS
jgi:hypothetical protein